MLITVDIDTSFVYETDDKAVYIYTSFVYQIDDETVTCVKNCAVQ